MQEKKQLENKIERKLSNSKDTNFIARKMDKLHLRTLNRDTEILY